MQADMPPLCSSMSPQVTVPHLFDVVDVLYYMSRPSRPCSKLEPTDKLYGQVTVPDSSLVDCITPMGHVLSISSCPVHGVPLPLWSGKLMPSSLSPEIACMPRSLLPTCWPIRHWSRPTVSLDTQVTAPPTISLSFP
jgi:hypothetical protein